MDQQERFKKLQRDFMVRAILAFLAFTGLGLSMLPLAPTFRQFFRSQIGGTLGECLLGLSFPLIASPPVIAFLV